MIGGSGGMGGVVSGVEFGLERVQEGVGIATESDTDTAPASDPEIFGTLRSCRASECGDGRCGDGSAARGDGDGRGGAA